MKEVKRFYSIKYLGVILIIVCLNLLLFYSEQSKNFQEYQTATPNSEKATLRETYLLVDEFVNSGQSVSSESIGLTDEEIANRILATRIIRVLQGEPSAYQNKIEQYLQNIQTNLNTAAYQEERSFGYQNMKKAQYDYAQMKTYSVNVSNGKALESILSYRYADYLVLLLLLIGIIRLVQERQRGIRDLTYTTAGGRSRLALKRCGILLGNSIIINTVIYGSLFAIALFLYGGIDSLTDCLHGSDYFMGVLLPMTKCGFLCFYFIVHCLSTYALSLLLWMLFSLCKGKNSTIAYLLGCCALEYILMTQIPLNSRFGIWKYFNLFSLIEPDLCLIGYSNFPFFGVAIDKRYLLSALIVLTILLCLPVSLLLESLRKPYQSAGLLDRTVIKITEWVRRISCHLTGALMELYKTIVLQKGWVVIVVLLILVMSQRYIVGVTYTEEEVMYHRYLDAIDIRTGEGTEEYLLGIENDITIIRQLLLQYQEEGRDTSAVVRQLQSFQLLKGKIESNIERKNRLLEDRGISIWLVKQEDYRAVFGERCSGYQELFALLALGTVIFLQAGVFSFEHKQGVHNLIKGTPGGRGTLFLKKAVSTIYLTTSIALVCYLPQLVSLYQGFGLDTWGAPLQSIEAFELFPISISIRTYLLWLLLYRLLVLLAAAFLTAAISTITTYRGSLLISLLMIIPYFLSLIGIDSVKAFSIIIPLAYNEEYLTYGFGVQSYIKGILWMGIGVAAMIAAYLKVTEHDRTAVVIKKRKEYVENEA